MTADTLIALVGAFALHAMRESSLPQAAVYPLPIVKTVGSTAPQRKEGASLGVEVSARAAIVMDVESGAILFEKNADEVLSVASLTKLVTAMTFLDQHPDLTQVMSIKNEDDGEIGGTVFKADEILKTSDVFDSMLVGSVNESANALARVSLGREAFVIAMNKKAESLGMRGARFVDPAGLGSQNMATARDIAIALKAASAYPEIRDGMAKPSLSLSGTVNPKGYKIKSTNLLLATDMNRKPYKIVAAKSGTLPEAGYCFAQITEGPDGHRVISIVLNDDAHLTRFQDVKALTYWAFRSFDWSHATRS
ncbi:MAG: serine hydrolase [Candidatus Uhrbacteria bacterium]